MVLKQVLGLRGYIPIEEVIHFAKRFFSKTTCCLRAGIYMGSLKTQKLENLH